MKLSLYIILLCFLAGCNYQSKSSSDSALPVLDISKDYPKKELDFHEIADVEYIPLETTDKSLIAMGADLVITEKYIFTYDFTGPVFIFDRKGKHIRSIEHYGRGPKEHDMILSLAVDSQKEEYYIYEHRKIQVYDFEGEWKRTLKIPEGAYYEHLFNCNEQYLIGVNKFHDLAKVQFKNSPIDKSPYHLIDKETSACIPLPITIDQWMTATSDLRVSSVGENKYVLESSKVLGIIRMLANSNDFLISEYSKDTLYTYKDNCLSPLAVRHPSVHSYSIPVVISPSYYTDDYLFFKPVELKADKNDSYKSYNKAPLLMWNRNTDEILHITRLYDSNRQGRRQNKATMKRQWIELPNCHITSIPADQLYEEYEAGQLKGKLKEVASKLKEDDNYVVAIYKFK